MATKRKRTTSDEVQPTSSKTRHVSADDNLAGDQMFAHAQMLIDGFKANGNNVEAAKLEEIMENFKKNNINDEKAPSSNETTNKQHAENSTDRSSSDSDTSNDSDYVPEDGLQNAKPKTTTVARKSLRFLHRKNSCATSNGAKTLTPKERSSPLKSQDVLAEKVVQKVTANETPKRKRKCHDVTDIEIDGDACSILTLSEKPHATPVNAFKRPRLASLKKKNPEAVEVQRKPSRMLRFEANSLNDIASSLHNSDQFNNESKDDESDEDVEMESSNWKARTALERILKMDTIGEHHGNKQSFSINGIKFSLKRSGKSFSTYHCTSCKTKSRKYRNKKIKRPMLDSIYVYKEKIYGNREYHHICRHVNADSSEENETESTEENESGPEEDDEMSSLSHFTKETLEKIMKLDVIGEHHEAKQYLILNGLRFSRKRTGTMYSIYHCTSCTTKSRANRSKKIKSPMLDSIYVYKEKIYGNPEYRHICGHVNAEHCENGSQSDENEGNGCESESEEGEKNGSESELKENEKCESQLEENNGNGCESESEEGEENGSGSESTEENESGPEEDDEMSSLRHNTREALERIMKLDVIGEHHEEKTLCIRLIIVLLARQNPGQIEAKASFDPTNIIMIKYGVLEIKTPMLDSIYVYKGKIYGNPEYRHICRHVNAETELNGQYGSNNVVQIYRLASILQLPIVETNSYKMVDGNIIFEDFVFGSQGCNRSGNIKFYKCMACKRLSKILKATCPGYLYFDGENLYGTLSLPSGKPHMCMKGLTDSQIQDDENLLNPNNVAEMTVDEFLQMLKDPDSCYPELASFLKELQMQCAGNESHDIYIAFTREHGTIAEILASIVWIGRANKIQLRAKSHGNRGPLHDVLAEHEKLFFAPLLVRNTNFEKCRNLEALLLSLSAMNGFYVKWQNLKNTVLEKIGNNDFRKWLLNENDQYMVENDMLVKALKQMVHSSMRMRCNFYTLQRS